MELKDKDGNVLGSVDEGHKSSDVTNDEAAASVGNTVVRPDTVSDGVKEVGPVEGNKLDVQGPAGSESGSPIEGTRNNVPVDKIIDDANKEMVNGVGKIADPNKELRDRIKEKLEDKSPASVKADLSVELGNPGAERFPRAENTGNKTVQREDGTLTTTDNPDMTVHYLHGTRVLITDEQKEHYDSLLKEVNDLAGNTAIGDIPTSDPYWEKKKELDAYVARLKR